MDETPMQGLADYLRERGKFLREAKFDDSANKHDRWASEVEAARASLPAPAHISDLIDKYWDLAYAEGKEGRTQDTQDGAAQRTRAEIDRLIRAPLAAPLPDEALRAVGSRLANMAFNMAQRGEGYELSAEECAGFKQLQREWDAAIVAARHGADNAVSKSDEKESSRLAALEEAANPERISAAIRKVTNCADITAGELSLTKEIAAAIRALKGAKP